MPNQPLADHQMYQCEGVWRLVAVPSSVEDLTVDFMMGSHMWAVTQLAAALQNPSTALRHITLRGTPSSTCLCDLACTLVAVSSQLETLCLVELNPFVHNALDKTRSPDQVMLACRQLQFSSVGFISTQHNTSDLRVAWDRLFANPRLRCIMVSILQDGCLWPSTMSMDPPPPPPVLVPGRRVIIKMEKLTFRDYWDATEWLKRIADTATEVEFHLDTFPYVHDLLGMMDQPSTAWTHATLHLAVLNWSMIHADSSVKTITRCLDLIAPTLVGWMNAQHNHNMATTEMKVYAHLEHDVLPNITNEDLAILLPHAVQLWNDEQYAAVRLWLQSHDILRLVRGPLTPWG